MQPFSGRFRIAAAAVVVALARPDAALAQGAMVSAVDLTAHHQLLGGPLTGVGAQVSIWPRKGQVGFRLGAEWLRGQTDRFGIPCGGFIQPGTCAPEPLRDEARLTSASVGMALRVFARKRVAVDLTTDLTLASVRAETRGLASGRMLPADKMLWGPLLGIEADWTPLMQVPIAIRIGGAVGGLMPSSQQQVLDGYTPFEDGFGLTRVHVGVAWQLRSH